MAINLNVDVNNENEFNQQLQLYLAQGYSMQSNINGTAILKKKSYSVGVLIVLIIFFFPAAIIYYLLASDDIVTIRNRSGQPSGNATATSATPASTESFDSYCEECGHGLFKDSKFCPGCGRNLTAAQKDLVDSAPKESAVAMKDSADAAPEESADVEKKANNCSDCGTELSEEEKFCPNCGKEIIR